MSFSNIFGNTCVTQHFHLLIFSCSLKRIGLFLRQNHLLRWCSCISLQNLIGTLTWSLLLKLPPRDLILRLLCISINLSYDLTWNTVVMSGLVLLAVTSKHQINYKNRYEGPFVHQLLGRMLFI